MTMIKLLIISHNNPTTDISMSLGSKKNYILDFRKKKWHFLVFPMFSWGGGPAVIQLEKFSRRWGLARKCWGLWVYGGQGEGYFDWIKIFFNSIARKGKRRKTWLFTPSSWKVLEQIEHSKTKCNLGPDAESQQGKLERVADGSTSINN